MRAIGDPGHVAAQSEREPAAAAQPVTFARTVGLYTPAKGRQLSASVLFLSPWGFEEMCTRKLWRILADRFTEIGVASLRFDYPGTGDSLDAVDHGTGLPLWEDSIVAAAAELRRLSGAHRIVLVGHGLGAALAGIVAPRLTDVEAIVMMAPVVEGRSYLRELAAWSKMVDEGLGLKADQRMTGHIAIAGLVMPDQVAAEVKKLALSRLEEPPAPRILVVQRPNQPRDAGIADHFEACGADVGRLPYTGYEDLVSNPAIARQPEALVEKLVNWLGRGAEPFEPTTSVPGLPKEVVLHGKDFIETPLRFGEGDRLFGILCRPLGQRRGATVIQLGTAYDRAAGWGRSSVETARYLASNGVASLRFDAANVGDSPPAPAAPEQVLFADSQVADVRAALDLVKAHELGSAILAGRCSGAYLAFRGAVADARCKAALVVNPYTYVWDHEEIVDEALRQTARSLEDYRSRALRAETLRRLAAGDIDLARAVLNISKQIGRRLSARSVRLGSLSRQGRIHEAIHADFRILCDRGVPLTILYSGGDVGLHRYRLHFGREGAGMKRYPNVAVEIVPDADHNMSPSFARVLVRDRILQMALKF
ncbi:hypothetical protein ASD44_16645 [Mesorhizobium sp. Root554]|uniref:alpha/beta hydrolase n=1 Tax=unclassified Mesorhizobium TaxID=325217 RepID=UPI0006F6CE7D|nr:MULTISPECIES: alpha/beta hydrolase [unclassified Mesorhizobium]KQZ15502.1 hypothetical protein ASD27_16650 [Mesorhizobium sp. Root1471]KQZ38011.1 hypothetical protein ASD44_16645 [Mesorhizobium sp. Root554]